ncbi:zinc ribbon domain-containing protein [Thermosyntropha sp.]|uniref:FmdB family zinc ribbon protein n=1 Tax=Thermosyntropha sp. TaxID=2740820 RepID=UPI00344E66AE|nr:zinc ribbon domain-containing protein [Thermosyntropha sp.]
MPVYDFKCKECGNKFDLLLSFKELDKARCSKCGSYKVEKQLSSFFAPGSAASSCTATSCSGCSGCKN